MSKYKKEEIQAINEQYDQEQKIQMVMHEEEDDNGAMNCQTINQLLDINVEQNEKLREEQIEIKKIKGNFQNIIDTMLKSKKQLFKESMKIEESIERVRHVLSPEQTAKFLILMEKFKSKKEFSVFSLWNIRELDQKNVIKKSINFNNNLQQVNNKASQEEAPQDGQLLAAAAE